MAIADRIRESTGQAKFDAVVLATGEDFPDALAGGYLAGKNKAPILIINEKRQSLVSQYIRENLRAGGTIYVLGAEAAVPEKLVSGFKSRYNVRRLAGRNRYLTNIEILREAGVRAGGEILVATGTDFADALSASAVPLPIFLVNGSKGKLTIDQISYLNSLKGSSFHILGSEKAVPKSIEKTLKTYGAVDRIAGKNRYKTSVEIARRFYPDPSVVTLAYAKNFPDGLCGGVLASDLSAPMLLVIDGKESDAAAYAADKGVSVGAVFGSSDLIGDKTILKTYGEDTEIEVYKAG
jgi:putative cell wall-binding protein